MWQRLPAAAFRWLTIVVVGSSMVLAQLAPDFRAPSRASESKGAPTPAPLAPVLPLPIPNDAVLVASHDLQSVPVLDRIYTRYLFNPLFTDKRNMRLASLIANYQSRGTTIRRPVPVADGMLLRVDLRWFAPKRDEIDEYVRLWEEFAFDPSFARLITKDVLAQTHTGTLFLPVRHTVRRVTRRERVENPDGTFSYQIITRDRVEEVTDPGPPPPVEIRTRNVNVVRLNSQAIDGVVFSRLQRETHSIAPVVELKYFISRAIRTIKDKELYKEVFGGLYYDLRGIKKAKDVLGKDTKATDRDLFFESVGVGNIKGGLTFEQLFAKLRSDQRAIVHRSGVTGKPRGVSMFNTPSGRQGTGWGSITDDVRDQDVDVKGRANFNLLNFQPKAQEAIFPGPNGLVMGVLFNDQGALQDEVPPDVAADATIPDSIGTKRLEGMLSCITCHSIRGKDGWQPVVNEIKTMLRYGFDIFGERNKRGSIVLDQDTTDRLRGLYTGDFSLNLSRARDDLAMATLEATGPWEGSEDQSDVCRLAAQYLHDTYYFQWLGVGGGIGAKEALAELGLDVPKEQALSLWQEIMAPDARSRILDITLESPTAAAIGSGLGVTRSDWALFRDFAAERVSRSPTWQKLRGIR